VVTASNVHQSKSTDHDRLGFHPDCPICRQDRLFGVLSPEPIWSRRVRVLLATGVLALSAGATTTSVAAEPDNQQEGVVVSEPGAPPPEGQSGGGKEPPDDELGQGSGGETALPFEVDPVLGAPQDDASSDGSDDSAPLETEPSDDPDGRLPLTGPDTPDGTNADDLPVPPTETPPPLVPAPTTEPPVDANDPTESSEAVPPAAKPEQPRRGVEDKRDKRRPSENGQRTRAPHEGTTTNPPTPSAPTTDAPALGAGGPTTTVAAAAPPPGIGRFHVVQPGESLWSIATDLLGPRASDAAIALEVQRLWELNKKRIGTDNPDLLIVGVKLRLR